MNGMVLPVRKRSSSASIDEFEEFFACCLSSFVHLCISFGILNAVHRGAQQLDSIFLVLSMTDRDNTCQDCASAGEGRSLVVNGLLSMLTCIFLCMFCIGSLKYFLSPIASQGGRK